MSYTIPQLENHIEALELLVVDRDLALKLGKNREFNKLILEEFCVNECARFARNSADPALSAQERADSLGMAQAAGHLKRWLSHLLQQGEKAVHDIAEAKAMIEELRTAGEDT